MICKNVPTLRITMEVYFRNVLKFLLTFFLFACCRRILRWSGGGCERQSGRQNTSDRIRKWRRQPGCSGRRPHKRPGPRRWDRGSRPRKRPTLPLHALSDTSRCLQRRLWSLHHFNKRYIFRQMALLNVT